MPQSGYTPILIYGSGTPGNTPSASDLTSSAAGAELAINYADGKLFYKDGAGSVQVLATKGAGTIGGANTQIQFNNSGTLGGSSGLTWDGTSLSTTGTTFAARFIPTSGSVSGTGMYLPSANTLGWSNNGTLTMVLDSAGNLGLGVTPSAWGSTYKAMQLSTGCSVNGRTNTENQVALSANAFHNGTAWTYIASTSATQYQQAAGAHYWYNAPSGTAGNAISFTQAMTLDVSGNLLVGATSIVGSARFGVAFAGDFTNALALNDTVSASGSGFAYFQTGGSTIGSITRVGATSAVAYNTTSDQSLKSNIEDAAPVIDKLMQVQVRQYDWTEGQVHQDYGFIAQEIEPILSGVVTKGKTDVDMWQLDYSKLTPHLLKAIQEQQAIITQLQADVAALKA